MPFGIQGGPNILQPRRRVIARVLIEVEEGGKTQCKPVNLSPFGQETPMHPLSLCSLLAQLVSTYLIPLNNTLNQEQKGGTDAEGNTESPATPSH